MTGFRMMIIEGGEDTRGLSRVYRWRESRVAVLGVAARTQLSARSTSLFSMKLRFRSAFEQRS